MYNSELKLRFISEITTSAAVAKSYELLFNRVSEFEKMHGTDLCLFSEDKLLEVTDIVISRRTNTTKSNIRQVNTYLLWCYKNGFSKSYVDFGALSIRADDKIKEVFAKDINDFADRLNVAFKRDDEMSQDIVYKCYFWLAFMMIPEEYALTLSNESVDIENCAVHLDGAKYDIPEIALESFSLCKECTAFRIDRHSHVEVENRSEGRLFLRTIGGTEEKIHSAVRSSISKRRKRLGFKFSLSYSNVLLSSAFISAYKYEADGIPADFSHVTKLLSRVDNPQPSTIRRAKTRYKEDYYAWKRAYKLK